MTSWQGDRRQFGSAAPPGPPCWTLALQGCVTSPLLFTLLTHDCTWTLSFNFFKFTDHTTVVGWTARVRGQSTGVSWVTWYKDNHFCLNMEKTNGSGLQESPLPLPPLHLTHTQELHIWLHLLNFICFYIICVYFVVFLYWSAVSVIIVFFLPFIFTAYLQWVWKDWNVICTVSLPCMTYLTIKLIWLEI